MKDFRKLNENDNELYQRVDEVLHYVWDPIGVSDVPEARDEYYSYLPDVFNLLKQGATERQIVEYLGEITSQKMGLGRNRANELEVADILVRWRSLLDEKA